jgi:hypothetical protein
VAAVASLVARPEGLLPAGVQFPATVAVGGRLLLMGGLDQATASVADIVLAGPGGSARIGTLPYAVHDAAGASLGGTAYLLGGGEPSYSDILAVGRAGRAMVAGHLPVGASDVAAGVVGGTVYVVGGYTGVEPLDTIVAWSGSGMGKVVARLPHPVRYAAVAAIGGRLIVAGGTNGDTATRDIYSFDPADGGSGRSAGFPDQGSQSSAIAAIDPVSGRVRHAGRLPVALSDTGVAAIGREVMLAGGREANGVLSRRLYVLRPSAGTA